MYIPTIVLAGQSNAAGVPEGYGTLPVALQGDQVHRYSYCVYGEMTTAYNDFLAPLASIRWGAEITLGDEITTNLGQTYCVIKVAVGDTSLAVDWQVGGTMFEALTETVREAIRQARLIGLCLDVTNFLWMQGETDAQTEAYADAYQANFTQMESDFQAQTGLSGYATIIGRIHNSLPAGSFPYSAAVRAAQDALGLLPGHTTFSTDALGLRGDFVHFDSTGLQDLGVLFYNNL